MSLLYDTFTIEQYGTGFSIGLVTSNREKSLDAINKLFKFIEERDISPAQLYIRRKTYLDELYPYICMHARRMNKAWRRKRRPGTRTYPISGF